MISEITYTDAPRKLHDLLIENKRLRAENASMAAALAPRVQTPLEWGLTPTETRVYSVLKANEKATFSAFVVVFGAAISAVDLANRTKVHVCHIRKKLRPFCIEIRCLRGFGFELVSEAVR